MIATRPSDPGKKRWACEFTWKFKEMRVETRELNDLAQPRSLRGLTNQAYLELFDIETEFIRNNFVH